MNFFKITRFLLVLIVVSAIFSCGELPEKSLEAKDYNADVYLKWHEFYLKIERHMPGFRPAPGSRALSHMSLSAYHAILPGMPEYNSLESVLPNNLQIPEIESGEVYHWPTVVNASYAFMMKKFFAPMANGVYANLYSKIDEIRDEMNDEFKAEIDAVVFDRSFNYGEKVANVVYEWSKLDGGHDADLDPQPAAYIPPTGPGLWQPTYPNFAKAMFPYYGFSVKPFAMQETDLICPPPIQYSEAPGSLFRYQAQEVQLTVNNIKNNGPGAYEDLWIAEFWSDDILNQTFGPPSRWIAILDQVVASKNSSLEDAALAYAQVSMALRDYVIASWKSKYYYNVERPTSYIRRLIEPNWTTMLNDQTNGNKPQGLTPAFPAYPSGHSGMGGAAAVPMSDIFGSSYSMVDHCHEFRVEFNGKPRAFNNFYEMAYENAISRVPLGVHFEMDCIAGLELGYLAGKRVVELPWKK